MIEIDIPSIDPMQHQPKIFFGMTSRQCLCIVPGVSLGAALFWFTRQINMDVAICLCITAVVPFVCLGWITPYNMKFEQFVKLWFFNTFISNPRRIYKTDNAQEEKMMTIKERQELESKQKAQALNERKSKKNSKKNADKADKEL